MIRPTMCRPAASATRRLLSTSILRSLPISTARYLSTETVTSTTSALSSSPAPRTTPAISALNFSKSHEESSSSKNFSPPEATEPQATQPQPEVRQLSYVVQRTKQKNLPIYEDSRSGGTRKLTQIRRILGNQQDMKRDIIKELGFAEDDVKVNPVTLHVVLKGHHKSKLHAWLTERGF